MEIPELIYCADGNREFARIAIQHGFVYGAQVLRKNYFPIEFGDLDPNNIPQKEDYIKGIKEKQPRIATVMDWQKADQFPEILAWAEAIAPYVEIIIIIPKVVGSIPQIPESINNTPIRLGYSVPTKHGGTDLPVWEFGQREVHLLGGSPQKQKRLMHYLNVKSADGNMFHLMATKFCSFFDPQKTIRSSFWAPLQVYDGKKWGSGGNQDGAHYEAFRRSCENIMKYMKGQER